jgi:hypothetical protein
MRDGVLFNLSRSLSLCFQKEANSELFFPTQNNIFATEYIDREHRRETRDQEISSLVRDKRDQNFVRKQTKNKQTNKKKIFQVFGWMEAE